MAQSRLDLAQVRSILSEYRIHNADVTLRCDATADDLIDVVEGNRSVLIVSTNGALTLTICAAGSVPFYRVYIPCIYVLNKIDQISVEVSSCREVDSWIPSLKQAHTHTHTYTHTHTHTHTHSHTLTHTRNWTLSTRSHMQYLSLHITSGTLMTC